MLNNQLLIKPNYVSNELLLCNYVIGVLITAMCLIVRYYGKSLLMLHALEISFILSRQKCLKYS